MTKPLIDLPYAILIGLTPLIPLPFVDDWVASLLMRRMVSELGLAYKIKLTRAEIDHLIAGEAVGCLGGCLSSLLLYPLLKRILREVFFILEWQRAINFVSQSYYYAYLLDTVFENGWYTPGSLARAAQVNAAIHRVRKTANTSLVRRVVEFHFNNSKNAVTGTARWLYTQLKNISLQRAGQRLRGLWNGIRRKKPIPYPPPVDTPDPVVEGKGSAAETSPTSAPAEATTDEAADAPSTAVKRNGWRGWFTRRREQGKSAYRSSPRQPPPRKNRPLDEVLHMEFLWLRVGELAVKIQEDLTRLPRGHFDELKKRLADELAVNPSPPFQEGDTLPIRRSRR